MIAYPERSDEENGFHLYAYTIDQSVARYDPSSRSAAVYVMHESFEDPENLSEAEQRQQVIRQTALRIVAGLEDRSLRELALSIGCRHTAIDNAVKRLCERIGMRKFHTRDATRAKQREARLRFVAEQLTKPTPSSP